ncbi:sensor histidine kinase [Tumebacillus flagellatus]|uniref:sensor histidine kinase n=1 Tax=Tumebacillus flagellatus TaxID=1157490 RepID=UPI000570BBAE|nr:ATP-binding protein [Tumebacillus flagellatus]
MKMRTQLLIISVVSLGLLVGALLIGYRKMILTFEQTSWLTGFALAGGLLSLAAYWLMTAPIVRSMKALVQAAEKVGDRRFEELKVPVQGPAEVRRLAVALQETGNRLHRSFQQLQEGERARRELVANVSHDLRTPLSSIQSFVEALQDNVVQDPESVRQYLATIHAETKRMGAMIEDLFELSKLEARQEQFVPVWAHLEQVLVEVLDSHALLLREKKLRVEVQMETELPQLRIMPEKVSRVIGNLLQNAVRHTKEGGVLQVAVRRKTEQAVEIALRDQGEGVPMEERTRIFERGYRTDKSRNRESGGAGLGLAIARSLVELHGGQIGVREREDGAKGSEFWFTLPM